MIFISLSEKFGCQNLITSIKVINITGHSSKSNKLRNIKTIGFRASWLVGCFGLNGPLRQYFSLYRAVSQREGERTEVIDERKNVQTTPTRTYCKYNRPLPYCNPNQEDAPALEVYQAPSHHPTTPFRARNITI